MFKNIFKTHFILQPSFLIKNRENSLDKKGKGIFFQDQVTKAPILYGDAKYSSFVCYGGK